MPRMEFEPTFQMFERAKTVLVLDRAATAIGVIAHRIPNYPIK
jgi:hypothetical protein